MVVFGNLDAVTHIFVYYYYSGSFSLIAGFLFGTAFIINCTLLKFIFRPTTLHAYPEKIDMQEKLDAYLIYFRSSVIELHGRQINSCGSTVKLFKNLT